MKSLKIRVWHLDHKIFTYLDLSNLEDVELLANLMENEVLERQLSTNLYDKNGKEVYQGDILKVTANYEGYGSTSYEGYIEVTFETCGYGLRMFNPSIEEMDKSGRSWDSCSLMHIEDDNGKWIEVIGNIYENPDLLPHREEGSE